MLVLQDLRLRSFRASWRNQKQKRATIAMRYLTDGIHLYEVVTQRTVQNYGLRRGTISYTIIRDCVSEATATFDDLQLAALSAVR